MYRTNIASRKRIHFMNIVGGKKQRGAESNSKQKMKGSATNRMATHVMAMSPIMTKVMEPKRHALAQCTRYLGGEAQGAIQCERHRGGPEIDIQAPSSVGTA